MAEGLLVDFGQILCGVLLEFFDAGSAAEFQLLLLINEVLLVTHLPQFFARDDAGIKGVGFEFRFGGFLGDGFCGRIDLQNWSRDHCHRKQEKSEEFHGVYRGMVWISYGITPAAMG